MATIHEWVQSLLPDIIPRLPEDAVHETYYYKHTFTDSITIVEYRKNEVILIVLFIMHAEPDDVVEI